MNRLAVVLAGGAAVLATLFAQPSPQLKARFHSFADRTLC